MSRITESMTNYLYGDVLTYLQETNLRSSLTEALSADVESILTDDGVTVAANTAKEVVKGRGTCIPHTIDGYQRRSSWGGCSTG